MAKKSPTSRSLERCRLLGWPAGVVERWIPVVMIRKDLFGFGDIVAMDGKPGALIIQATGGGNGSARLAKIIAIPEAKRWLEAGNRIAIWDWKRGRGGAGVGLKERAVALADFAPAPRRGRPRPII